MFLGTVGYAKGCGTEDKSKSTDGVEAVDLGLSVLWADCNVGATMQMPQGGLYGLGDPTGKKKHKLLKLEKKLFKCCYLSGMIPSDTKLKYNDPCNNLHNQWHNPWYPLIPRTDSIFDIINKTMPIYIKRINMYINAVGNAAIETTDMDSVEETNYYLHNRNILLVELSDNSYLTGLPIK